MPLITRTLTEILKRIKDRFDAAGYSDVSEVGSPANVISNTLSPEISSLYRSIEQAHKSTDITKAVGDELSAFAKMFGISRGTNQPAVDTSTNNVKFFIDPIINKTASTLASEYSLTVITIPLGTILRAGGVQYKTTSEVELAGNNTEVFVPVSAMGTGESYNVISGELSKHNLSAYPVLAKVASFIKCTNLLPISSGQDVESDGDLRQRVRNANSVGATANQLAIIAAARNVSGVSDAAILPYIYGSGTLAVFIESTTPVVSPGLINAVQVTVDSVKADGNRVYVQYPDYKALKIYIEATLSTGSNEDEYTNAVKPAVVDYVNNLPRGESFTVRNLQSILSANGVAVNAIVQKIQVGEYNIYTRKLLNVQTFLPTTQMLAQTEKWYTNSSLVDICIVNE